MQPSPNASAPPLSVLNCLHQLVAVHWPAAQEVEHDQLRHAVEEIWIRRSFRRVSVSGMAAKDTYRFEV